MVELFHGPKLKIERAKRHISDLHARFLDFTSTNYYRLDIEKDLDTGNNFVKFSITDSLPEDAALIIGDAFHNLRSALDYAVSDVLFKQTGARSDFANFPVRDSRDKLIDAIRGGDIGKAPQAILDFIVDGIRPYVRGDETILALHRLDILDKHILLLPTLHIGALVGVSFEDDRGNKFSNCDLLVESGRFLIPISTPGNIKITDPGKPSISVWFERGLPLEGQLVLPTLVKLTKTVSHIVEEFERISEI